MNQIENIENTRRKNTGIDKYLESGRKIMFILFLVFTIPTAHAHRNFSTGIHQLDWHNPQIEKVTSGFGGSQYGGTTEFIDGKHCMVSDSLYFDVLDDYAFDIDETVELTVEFDLKEAASTVQLSYDANAPKSVGDGSFAIHGYTQKIKLPE